MVSSRNILRYSVAPSSLCDCTHSGLFNLSWYSVDKQVAKQKWVATGSTPGGWNYFCFFFCRCLQTDWDTPNTYPMGTGVKRAGREAHHSLYEQKLNSLCKYQCRPPPRPSTKFNWNAINIFRADPFGLEDTSYPLGLRLQCMHLAKQKTHDTL